MSRRRRCRRYCKTEQRTVRSLFGQPGSQYDFSKLDIAQLKDRTRDLEEQQRGMKKKVNPKAMNMIDTYVLPSPGSHMGLHNTLTLVQRREARSEPEKDAGHSTEGQGKIKQTIQELDQYKCNALKTMWEKVNGYARTVLSPILKN